MPESDNPYSPPQTPPESPRENCPVCGNHVGFLRFALPLGACRNCGNYLTIRNQAGRSWFWVLAQLAILLGGWFSIDTIDYPLFTLLFSCLAAEFVYNSAVGQLVPAIWWGLLAYEDDPRLPKSINDNDTVE